MFVRGPYSRCEREGISAGGCTWSAVAYGTPGHPDKNAPGYGPTLRIYGFANEGCETRYCSK